MRWGVAVVVVGTLLAVGCAEETADFCDAAGDVLPSLDADDSIARWETVASAATGDVADAANALAVIARQVESLGPDAAFSDQAAVALRPAVARDSAVVTEAYRSTCSHGAST